MPAPGAPLSRTSRLLLLLLFKVSVSAALSFVPEPRNGTCLGESCSPLIPRRSRDAGGPRNSARDALRVHVPREKLEAEVRGATSWDLPPPRGGDTGVIEEAAASGPLGPPTKPPGAWRWKGAQGKEPSGHLGRREPTDSQLFRQTSERGEMSSKRDEIPQGSQEHSVKTEPEPRDLFTGQEKQDNSRVPITGLQRYTKEEPLLPQAGRYLKTGLQMTGSLTKGSTPWK